MTRASDNVEYVESGTIYLQPIKGMDVVRIQIEIPRGVIVFPRTLEWAEHGGSKETTVIIKVEVKNG